MKIALSAPLALLSLCVVTSGCSSAPQAGSSTPQADTTAQSLADTSCEIVLREAGESGLNGGEVYTDSNAQGWLVYRGDIDVDTTQLAAGAVAYVWYQADNYAPVTVQAAPSSDPTMGLEELNGGQNPPAAYTRLAFATTTNTMAVGDDGFMFSLQMIPYLQFPDGHTLYDHNRSSGNYVLNGQDQDAVNDNFSVCPAPLAPLTPLASTTAYADAGSDVASDDAGPDAAPTSP